MDHINAKIRAKKARLITGSGYRILCQSQSTEHFFAQLKTYPSYTNARIPMSMTEEMDRMRLFFTGVGAAFDAGLTVGSLMRLISFEKDHLQAWSYIKTLPNGSNRQVLTYIKGTEIDLHNILCIYRLKRYYPEAEVYPHLIPVFYRLNKEALKQMAESPGIAEFIVHLRHNCYGHIFGSFENPKSAVSQTMKLTFARMVKRYPGSIAGMLGYFFDKRIEIENLTAIMEGVRYRLPSDEIFSRLIM